MFKSLFKGVFGLFQRAVARCWIAPLDNLLWEMVSLERATFWIKLRMFIVWTRDLGRLVYSGFQADITRWDGIEWSIVYINDGSTSSEKELQHLFFSESPTRTKLGRVFIWKLPTLIRELVSQEYFVICELNRLIKWRFPEMYCVRVFPWLRALLDTGTPKDTILKRMTRNRRSELTKVEKHGFDYEVSHALEDFDLVYHNMYVPHATQRFGERMHISSYESQYSLFKERGDLLCVKHQGSLVAAGWGTLRRYGNAFSFLHLGSDPAFQHPARKDIITALYWHTISWAHANHISTIDFGRTRARLNDGVFLFKHRWGMRFEHDKTIHTMWTFIGKNLPSSLIHHLNDLAFVAQVGKKYQCVVFANNEASLSAKELARRKKISDRAGLDGLLVYQSNKIRKTEKTI